jgi:hypothetical protein
MRIMGLEGPRRPFHGLDERIAARIAPEEIMNRYREGERHGVHGGV